MQNMKTWTAIATWRGYGKSRRAYGCVSTKSAQQIEFGQSPHSTATMIQKPQPMSGYAASAASHDLRRHPPRPPLSHFLYRCMGVVMTKSEFVEIMTACSEAEFRDVMRRCRVTIPGRLPKDRSRYIGPIADWLGLVDRPHPADGLGEVFTA